MADWKKLVTFRGKRSIEEPVAENQIRFYPNRMALLEQAKDLSGPVARAINTLMVDKSRDSKSMVRNMTGPDEGLEPTDDGEEGLEPVAIQMQEITTDAVSMQMAEFRTKERNDAIELLLSTLCDVRNRVLLGSLWMDSMRDLFPYKKDRSTAEIEEFLYGSEEDADEYTGLDLPVMVQIFTGWMKANAKTFGKTGEQVVGFVQKRMGDLNFEQGSEQDPTSGENSKTPTSSQSEPGSGQTS